MTMGELGIGYVVVGAVLATVLAIVRRAALVDGAFVVVLWPIWIPLIVSRPPDRDATKVAARLRDVTARLADLEGVLARPDYDRDRAAERVREVAADPQAEALRDTVVLRLRAIDEMHALRGRYRAEVEELRALSAQLEAREQIARADR